MVVPGVGPASNRSVIELGRKFRGVIFPALGFHPERFEHSEDDAREVLEMIASQRHLICAIGEVGLPWYGEQASDAAVLDAAKVTLARFARAAVALDLPLILHAPHARAREALAIVRKAGVTRAVFHWHKSDEQTTRAILNAGYFISLTPEVAYRRARSGSRADASCGPDSPRDRRPVALRRPVRGTVDRAGDDQRSGRCDCASAMYDVRGNRHVDDGQCTSTFSNPRVN